MFDSKVVNFRDKVFLKCSATGIPLPMITWTLDGQSLDDIKNDPGESRILRQAMVSFVDKSCGQFYEHFINRNVSSVSLGCINIIKVVNLLSLMLFSFISGAITWCLEKIKL